MLKGKIAVSFILLECCLLALCFFHGATTLFIDKRPELRAKKELVGSLGLTDLAIWTEARYTRHPSQADFFSAFQDFPGAIDHFPAGSILAPRQRVRGETP